MLRHRLAIVFSGLLWLGIGLLLFMKGLRYLMESGESVFSASSSSFSIISFLSAFFGTKEQAALWLLFCACALGFIKGRFVMGKTVKRIVSHICDQGASFTYKRLYPKWYFIVLGGMMLLGMAFKFLPLPLDIKGLIDVTIGFALINGAMLYFKAAIPAHL